MSEILWTPSQRRAIDTVGRSLLVSAGAGSGKTAVLAERCAHLVAELKPPCGVDRLLVVTFTDAAAAEMRERIARALRARLEKAPGDRRLQQQLALLDSAHISTLHAFCRRVLGRYFAQADIDPQTPLIDPMDARLLRREKAREVFDAYEAREDARGEAFLNLVSAYSGGSDLTLMERVLSVDEFLTSILEPEHWTRAVIESHHVARAGELPGHWHHRLLASLRGELAAQRETVKGYLVILESLPDVADAGARCLQIYFDMLTDCHARLSGDGGAQSLESVCLDLIGGFEFPKPPRKSSKFAELPTKDQQAFTFAADLVRETRDVLFRRRLKAPFGLFRLSEWAEGIARTKPHVEIFLELVKDVRTAFQDAKRELGVIDFTDLERLTVRLLIDGEAGVAARLRDQFEHVLVDEFQDINPVQAEILRRISREGLVDRPSNLFTVGDVKQSIYRFRLAEPRLFLERKALFEGDVDASSGTAIDLAENFRSRPRTLDAANAVFERVMVADLGGIDYDAGARLKPGSEESSFPLSAGSVPLELHILDELRGAQAEDDSHTADDPKDNIVEGDAEDWLRIEREAYVIADRIESCVKAGYAYRDIVILLRSLQARAGLLVRTLARRGIPAYTDVSGGFFEAVEVQDVLCLLMVLDNEQQDIPLASILRSRLFGSPLTDSELVQIRTSKLGREATVPFHAAVRAYVAHGESVSLCERLADILHRIGAWRQRARRRVLAEVLWEIYEESGYLAHVSGLRDGTQRRANLVRLHEYARQFGEFRRQGLGRFLQFIEGIRDARQDLEPGIVSSGSDDVVRIMSIHRSKGLEFPVVILGELGKRFNLTDARGPVLHDRQLGLGLEAVDETHRIRYPTLPHVMVAQAIEREALAEEIRVLYVGLTRAKDRLILVGTKSHAKVNAWRERYQNHPGPLSLTDRQSATCMLDWIAQAICCHGKRAARFLPETPVAPEEHLFDVHLHDSASMKDWVLVRPEHPHQRERLDLCANFKDLPAQAKPEDAAQLVETLRRRLLEPYAMRGLTRIPAVASASVLKRRWEAGDEPDDPAAQWTAASTPQPGYPHRLEPIALDGPTERVDATERGTLTHEFLKRIDLRLPGDAVALRQQLDAFIRQCVFTKREAAEIDLDGISWFLRTPLGLRLQSPGTIVHREWPFVIGIDPARYDPTAQARDRQDIMLVRGIIDCLFDAGDGWEVLDYKTDRVRGDQLTDRASLYRGQLSIYAHAVEQTWGKTVGRRHLAFLTPREIVSF